MTTCLRHLFAFFAVASLGFASGCSLLIDTDQYQTPHDGAMRDGGMLDPTLPTPPVIEIGPATPSTIDDLVMTITTESTDPLAAGAITYEITWFQDDVDVEQSTATVPASATTKNQVWRVEVVPVAADARRGPAGTASVTIVNSLPVIGSVGLDHYRVILGDADVRAFASPVIDADGDPGAVRYTWYRNDAVIAGQTGTRLPFTSVPALAAGDTIRVEATARDTEADGNTVGAGPALVLADVTQWRQLTPDASYQDGGFGIYDVQHRRAVFGSIDQMGVAVVWEYGLDGTNNGQFVRLYPTGSVPPLRYATFVYDETNHRMLMLAGTNALGEPVTDIYALNLANRGQESWVSMAPGGTPPAPRLLPGVAFDEVNEHLYFYGGIDPFSEPEGEVDNDLYRLDLSDADSPIWTEIVTTMPPTPIVGGAMVVDAARNRLVLATGALLESASGGDPPPSEFIYTLDLANTASGFLQQPVLVPEPRYLVLSGLSPDGTKLLIAGGGGPDEMRFTTVIEIDLETLTSRVITPTGTGPAEPGPGQLVADPTSSLMMVFPGPTAFDNNGGFGLFTFDADAGVYTPLYVAGIDAPAALTQAALSYDGHLYGGRDSQYDAHEELWRLDVRTATWELIPTTADVVTTRTPGARYGMGTMQSNSPYSRDLAFFGGRTDSGRLPSEVWTIRDGDWILQSLIGASLPAPTPTEGAAYFMSACGNRPLSYFGGYADTFGVSSETRFFECTSDRNCQWEDPVGVVGARPPPRAWATAGLSSNAEVVLFGGSDGGTAYNDLWTFDTCGGGSASWQVPTIAGVPPSPRQGHSMTLIGDSFAANPEMLVFGGSGASTSTMFSDAFILRRTSPGSYQWSPVVVAPAPADQIPSRAYHAAIYDSRARRVLVFGGEHNYDVVGDLWELRLRDD